MRTPFGLPSQKEREYARPERLADVMALIQVLALDESAHRSEGGLKEELQGKPQSATSWTDLASDHPEFFRVKAEGKNRTSLVARHVAPKDTGSGAPLSADFVGSLLQAAIDIHDRQVRRSERWTYLVPIWVALIAGILAIAGVGLEALLGADGNCG